MSIITTRHFPPDYLQTTLDTLQYWTDLINNNNNFSFIKFGDGEFYCMMGEQGNNCDLHPYSRELGIKLIEAWNFFSSTNIPNIYIAEWGDQPGSFGTPQHVRPVQNINNPVHLFLQRLLQSKSSHNFKLTNFEIVIQNTLSAQKYNFYKSIKLTNRRKIFVGPERLQEVKSFLNTDYLIQIPLRNTFSKYEDILTSCKSLLTDNCIVMFSSGMPTKSIIHKLLEYKNNITCIDVGSGFDALFVGGTREGQLPKETVREFYKDLL